MKAVLKKIAKEKPIFIFAFFFLWIKTIVVGFVDFNITLENPLQFIILLLNPIPFMMLFFGWIFTRKPSRQGSYVLLFSLLCTIVLYVNGVYHREFTDYITVPLLLVGSNMADLQSSILTLVEWKDIIYFVDIVILVAVFWMKKEQIKAIPKYSFKQLVPYFSLFLILAVVNIGLANIERPQLLTRSFDRELLVKNVGIYNFHLYDVYLHTTTRAQRVFASVDELDEITEFMDEETIVDQDDTFELFGAGKGKNVILISAESVQNFVINNTVNGEEITPFLNELIKDSFYFEEFYHQTAQGKTADAEFLVDNSLYPLSRGSVFFTHATNEYYSLPEIMVEHGYFTASLHANKGSFWNRDLMYETLGYNKFYTDDYYEITEENSVGWGLKDIDFMEQSVQHMVEMPKPFHAKLITLTNHFPFDLDDEDKFIDEFDSNSKTLNQYFPTVRYTDEAIRIFFDQLKETGIYEDSIVIIYGDHYGISKNHNKAMGQYLQKEVTPFVEVQLQQVPMIIHIPGFEGKKISSVGGQIDIRPTLLYLLGIEMESQMIFGKNLFSKEREELVILRNGSFITKDAIYTRNTCYSKETGEPFDLDGENPCSHYMEDVQLQLDYSDRIIYGDLFRFDETLMQVRIDKEMIHFDNVRDVDTNRILN
ncbi:LTA synthase family protein [Evansella sp. AB-rgal1]|uniref:LTA synthase family protein n=1 Tax=Evansella sp. AB-rgal1 TaxID=3242696 RepID=UPI00359E56C3